MIVDEVRLCPWCRRTLPVGHSCVGDGLAPCAPDVACGSPSDLPEVTG